MRGKGQTHTPSLRKQPTHVWSLADGLPQNWEDLDFWAEHELGKQLSDTPQHALYHQEGDVWKHTCLVAQTLQQQPAWQSLPPARKNAVLLASILHDWGKAQTTAIAEDGHWHAPHHAARGARMARALLWQTGLHPVEREYICSLVGLHMRPYHCLEKNPTREMITWGLQCRVEDLLLLTYADSLGRKPARLDWGMELLSEEAQNLNIHNRSQEFSSNYMKWWWQQDKRRPLGLDLPPPATKGQRLTVLHALPGTGKDYWANAHCDEFDTIISLDRLGNEGMSNEQVAGHARNLLRRALGQGNNVLWNATTLTRQQRQGIMGIARDYNCPIHLVQLEASADRLFSQNANRAASVPHEVILKMLQKWEPPSPQEFWSREIIHDDWPNSPIFE